MAIFRCLFIRPPRHNLNIIKKRGHWHGSIREFRPKKWQHALQWDTQSLLGLDILLLQPEVMKRGCGLDDEEAQRATESLQCPGHTASPNPQRYTAQTAADEPQQSLSEFPDLKKLITSAWPPFKTTNSPPSSDPGPPQTPYGPDVLISCDKNVNSDRVCCFQTSPDHIVLQ